MMEPGQVALVQALLLVKVFVVGVEELPTPLRPRRDRQTHRDRDTGRDRWRERGSEFFV